MLETSTMKPLRIYLPEELKKKFRKFSMESYGYSRGSLSRAAVEAIKSWISTHQTSPEFAVPDEPVKALRGLLRHEGEACSWSSSGTLLEWHCRLH